MSNNITLPSIANFRQLGGLKGVDGRKVVPNQLFRCSALDCLSEQDAATLAQLPALTIVDYRDVSEASLKPDRPVIGGKYLNIPANPPSLEVDAKVIEFSPHAIAALDVDRFMTQLYQQLPFHNPAWRQLISVLSEPSTASVIQHCAVGKDRTGIGSAITLMLLGCEESVIIDDYLATQGQLDNIADQALAHWPATGQDQARTNFQQLLSVNEAWLAAALTAIKQRYGSTENWLAQEYGVSAAQRQIIQDKWLLA